jgi:ankyrin repeat protein
VGFGHTEAVKLLLRRGADVRKHSGDAKMLPLWQAAAHGHTDVVKALLAGGAKVEENSGYDSNCPTALFAAAYRGKLDAVRVLLEAGADGGSRNSIGLTAADIAAMHNQLDATVLSTCLPGNHVQCLYSRLTKMLFVRPTTLSSGPVVLRRRPELALVGRAESAESVAGRGQD